MPNIADYPDMGLRTVLQSGSPRNNAYLTPTDTQESRRHAIRCELLYYRVMEVPESSSSSQMHEDSPKQDKICSIQTLIRSSTHAQSHLGMPNRRNKVTKNGNGPSEGLFAGNPVQPRYSQNSRDSDQDFRRNLVISTAFIHGHENNNNKTEY
ncbi:hypothetical protein TNCV_2012971 [Trichonephila clavipes]|nr:hypothetical protein TNCV_2012971 [Trichonephila clavipes]